MKIFYFFLRVLIFFCISYSNVTADDFNVVSQNCSFLKAYSPLEMVIFKNLTNFKECRNWTSIIGINSTQQFSTENFENIKCLLLYESFISFCNRLPKTQWKEQGIIFGKYDNLSVEQACKNLSILPKKGSPLEHIHSVITEEEKCKSLCSNYQFGQQLLDRVCKDSYYYSNINVTDHPSLETLSQNNDSVKLVPKNPLSSSVENPQAPPSQNIKDVIQKVETNDLTEGRIKPELESPTVSQEPNVKNIIPLGTEEKDLQNKLMNVKPNDVTNQEKELVDQKNSDNHINIEEPETKQEEEIDAFTNNQAVQNGDGMLDQQPIPEIKIDNKADNIEIDYDSKISDKPYLEADEIQEKEQAVPDRFKVPKPERYGEPFASSDADMDGNSNFFTYFSFICIAFVIGYVGYHNKQKVLALLVEGRNSRRPQRGRRPNSANYHKLDSNLEEAISSSCSKNTSHVIY